jgi:hypothetical protein
MIEPGTDLRRREWTPTAVDGGAHEADTVAVRLLRTTDAEGDTAFELDATTVEPSEGASRRYHDFVVGTYDGRDGADDAMTSFVRLLDRSLARWSPEDQRLPCRVREVVDSLTLFGEPGRPDRPAAPVAAAGRRDEGAEGPSALAER